MNQIIPSIQPLNCNIPYRDEKRTERIYSELENAGWVRVTFHTAMKSGLKDSNGVTFEFDSYKVTFHTAMKSGLKESPSKLCNL